MPDYLDRLANSYGAGVHLAPFAKNVDGARQSINRWVSLGTRGLHDAAHHHAVALLFARLARRDRDKYLAIGESNVSTLKLSGWRIASCPGEAVARAASFWTWPADDSI